jgi:SH3-like domain-containing protein
MQYFGFRKERDNWTKIQLADETVGWIKAYAIKELRSAPIAIGD